MKLELPFYMIMVGLPGCGKSTLIQNKLVPQICRENNISQKDIAVISTDAVIERYARENNSSYDEEFYRFKDAEKEMKREIQRALSSGKNIIKDMTHVSASSRRKALAMVPSRSNYHTYAVNVRLENSKEHERRLNCRNGKTIPSHVIQGMKNIITYASKKEGFDEVFDFRSY